MAIVQFRVDDETKEKATEIFDSLGIDLSTALRMFLKRCILMRGIPFPTMVGGNIVGTTDGKLTGREKEVRDLVKRIDEIETEEALAIMRECQEISEKNGNSKLTMEEIIDIIKLARKERRASNDISSDD